MSKLNITRSTVQSVKSNLSFAKMKNKSSNVTQKIQSGVKNTLKAVPLAALIAMSPLTTTNAKETMNNNPVTTEVVNKPQQNHNRVIAKKTFNLGTKGTYTVSAINTKGGTSTFNKISIKDTFNDYKLKNVSNTSFKVLSADYSCRDAVSTQSRLIADITNNGKIVAENLSIWHEPVVNYVKELINSSKNKSSLKNIDNDTLYIRASGFEAGSKDEYTFAYILKELENEECLEYKYSRNFMNVTPRYSSVTNNFSKMKKIKYFQYADKNGSFQINFYDKDGNINNFEAVSVKRLDQDGWENLFAGIDEVKYQVSSEPNTTFGPLKIINFFANDEDYYHRYENENLANVLNKEVFQSPQNNIQNKKISYNEVTRNLLISKNVPLVSRNTAQSPKQKAVESAKPQQNTQKAIANYSLTLSNGEKCLIKTVNTQGLTNSFNKIQITKAGHTYDVSDLLLGAVPKYVSADGMLKNLKQLYIVAGKNEKGTPTFFFDQKIFSKVSELLKSPNNKSNINTVPNLEMYISKTNSSIDKHALGYASQENVNGLKAYCQKFLKADELEKVLVSNEIFSTFGLKPTKEIESLRTTVVGDNAIYTVRFFDKDGNSNNFESVYVQSNSMKPKIFSGINNTKLSLKGEDINQQIGSVENVVLSTQQTIPDPYDPFEFMDINTPYHVADKKLADKLKEIVINSPKNNMKNKPSSRNTQDVISMWE